MNVNQEPSDFGFIQQEFNRIDETKQQEVKKEEAKPTESHWGYTITAYKNGQEIKLTAEQYKKLESLVKGMIEEKPALKDLKSIQITPKSILGGDNIKVADTDQKTFNKMAQILNPRLFFHTHEKTEQLLPKTFEKKESTKTQTKESHGGDVKVVLEKKSQPFTPIPGKAGQPLPKTPEKKESMKTQTKESINENITVMLKKDLPPVPEKKNLSSLKTGSTGSQVKSGFTQTGGHAGAFVSLADKPGFIQKREVKNGDLKPGGMKNETTMYRKIGNQEGLAKLKKFTPTVLLEDKRTNDDSIVMEDLSNGGKNKIDDIKLGHDLFSKTIHMERRDPKGIGGKISTAARTIRMGLYSQVVGEYSVQGSKKPAKGWVQLPFGISVHKRNEDTGSFIVKTINKKFNSTLESLGRIHHSRETESKQTMQEIINNLTIENKTKIKAQLNELKMALNEAPVAFYGSSILIITGKDAKGNQTADVKFIDVGNFLTKEEIAGNSAKQDEYVKLKMNNMKALDAIIRHGNWEAT
jgi:hypothetical protein